LLFISHNSTISIQNITAESEKGTQRLSVGSGVARGWPPRAPGVGAKKWYF